MAAATARSGRRSGRRRRHMSLRTPPGLTGSYHTGGKAREMPCDILGGTSCSTYVLAGAFPTAAPYRLRHRGYGVWIAAPAYHRRPGPTERFGQDYNPARPSQAEGSPQASGQRRHRGGGAFRPWREPGQPGAPGDKRQLFCVKSSSSAVPPFVRPIASEYPPTLGSHGVPQWDRGDDTDKMEPERPEGKIETIWRYDAPQGRLSRAGEGFSPAVSHVQGRIYLTHPFTVIESTAGGAALVAAAHAADRDRRGGSRITITRGV